MYKHVANNVNVNGPAEAVNSFVDACLCNADPGRDDFDLGATKPVVVAGRLAESDAGGGSGHRRQLWRPIHSAWDMVIIERRDGYVQFDFITASKLSEPIYRNWGRLYPSLIFDIAAIETESRWAITGRISGDRAEFYKDVDPDAVYDRVFEASIRPLADEH